MVKIKGLVVASMPIKEFNGNLNFGFKIDGEDQWFNAYGEEQDLIALKEEIVSKGNVIEFDSDISGLSNFVLIKKGKAEEKTEEGFADDIIPFEDVLNAAQEKANKDKLNLNFKSDLISFDMEKKFAVVKGSLILTGVDGNVKNIFEAYGDATQENISGSFVKAHFVRMAETRAYARALRWYTNTAKCVDVETDKGKLPETKKPEEKKTDKKK